jgi:hypothetical protein
MTIKIILIIFLVVVLRAFMVQKSLLLTNRLVASLLFLFLALLVVFPDVSTAVANAIGVGRGVDLVFYFSHLFLLFLIVSLWRRSIDLQVTVTQLARIIALQNPIKPGEKDSHGEKKTG